MGGLLGRVPFAPRISVLHRIDLERPILYLGLTKVSRGRFEAKAVKIEKYLS